MNECKPVSSKWGKCLPFLLFVETCKKLRPHPAKECNTLLLMSGWRDSLCTCPLCKQYYTNNNIGNWSNYHIWWCCGYRNVLFKFVRVLPLFKMPLLCFISLAINDIQRIPPNSGSVNSEILLIQTGDYGPCWAYFIYIFFIIRTSHN